LANEITFTVKLDDKGSLALVTKEAKKTAAGIKNVDNTTKKANKTQDHFARGAKGVGQAGLSASKGFSKMRDSMGGSNGLVSAYAILAANIFAATAAFNALRRAAQIEQLAEGLRVVGAAAGQNLPDIARNLKEITGAAVSTEIAMRSTALAISAGFRSDQLVALTKVAKGASIALGRDMGDALDRLVRGTAKLEPEILDELGIMVRLDDAVRVYAERLGIAEGNLTQFDRRQAFLNATIEQGLKKFEDLSKSVDPNPYDKLAASLADLQKNFLKTFSSFTGLNKMVSFASRNLSSLTAVASTLALGITKGVAPGLFRMADSAAASANGLLESRLALADVTTAGDKLPPKFKKLVGSLREGTATSNDFAAANRSLTGQLGALSKGLNRTKEGTAEYAVMQDRISGVRTQLSDLSDLEKLQGKARIESARASAIGNAANFNLVQSFKDLKLSFKEDSDITKLNTKGKKGLRNSLKALGPAFRIAGGGAKAFGAALFTALPFIGIIISLGSVLFNVIKEKFFPEDLVKKRIEDAKKSFEQFAEVQARFMTSTSKDGKRLVESYVALAGVLDQISGKIREVVDQGTSDLITNAGEEKKRLIAINSEIERLEQNKKNAIANPMVGTADALNYIEGQINKKLAERVELQIKADNLTETIRKRQLTNSKEVLRGAIFQLKIQQQVAAETETSAFNTELMAQSMKKLVNLQNKLDNGKITYEQFLVELELITRYPAAVRSAFQEIDTVISTLNATISKRRINNKKMFQEEEDGVDGVIKQFENLEQKLAEQTKGTLMAPFGRIVDKEAVAETKRLIKELEDGLEDLNLSDTFGEGKESLVKFKEFIETTRTSINRMTADLAKNKGEIAQLSKVAKSVVGGTAFIERETNKLLQEEIDLIQTKIDANLILDGRGEKIFKDTKAHTDLLEKQNALLGKKVRDEVITAKNAVDELKIQKQINDLSKKRMANDQRLFAIRQKANAAGGKLTPKQEFEFEVKKSKLAVETAKLDLDFTIAKITLERALLVEQFGGAEKLTDKHLEVLKLLDAQNEIVKQIARESVRSAGIGVTETIQGGSGEFSTGFDRMGSQGFGMSAVKTQIESMKEVAVVHQAAKEAISKYNIEKAELNRLEIEAKNATEGPDKEAALAAVTKAKEAASISSVAMIAAKENVTKAAQKMISEVTLSMSEALRELGPEGVLAATLGELSNTMMTSVVGAMEVMAEAGDNTAMKLSAGFAAAANIIGGIAAILSAQSNVAVDSIDKQIDAEKKLDGQSAKSVAKIKSMEAKKDAIKKKAFDTNKKLMIAQAVMATAAGIAGALAQTLVLGPFAIALAGMIGAMGVAQIALISGTSYQSTGGSPSVSGPSALSIGERGKGVDLATSRSARGELAYMRGEDGTGGSGNFRPAFTGAKYRASGGETAGFMVGEQGPEMFIPDRSGRIAPADDVQTAGAPAQVTFNINTIDASGVEDMLTVQRGNIIGMIRSAANSYGETFVEEVDTTMLQNTASAMGVGRY